MITAFNILPLSFRLQSSLIARLYLSYLAVVCELFVCRLCYLSELLFLFVTIFLLLFCEPGLVLFLCCSSVLTCQFLFVECTWLQGMYTKCSTVVIVYFYIYLYLICHFFPFCYFFCVGKTHGQNVKGEQLGFQPNGEENKRGIDPTEDPTVAKEKNDTAANHFFQIDGDTKDAESEQYHGNDDLTETDVSNDLLCAGVKNMIVKSFKRKQRRSTVRKGSLKRPRLTEATSHEDFGDAVCKAYSRCSVPYFSEVVNSICKSKNKVELVRSTGFGYMLELDDCLVPRPFAQWIANKVVVEDE